MISRISVLGGSGSGKSYLSAKLATIYSLPVTHIDSIYYLADWGIPKKSVFLGKFESILKSDCWIIDGNFMEFSFKKRIEYSDMVIFLDYNRFVCLLSIIRRYFKDRGKTRSDLAEGCFEGLSYSYIKDVLWEFPHKDRKELVKFLSIYPQKVKIFKSRRSLRKWVDNNLGNIV